MSTAGTAVNLIGRLTCVEIEETASQSVEEESRSEQSAHRDQQAQEQPRTSTESTVSGTVNLLEGVGRISISSEQSAGSDTHIVPCPCSKLLKLEWDG